MIPMTEAHFAPIAELERLQRSERNLNERVESRAAEVERAGGWLPSDPVYQRLASILDDVRSELRRVEASMVFKPRASSRAWDLRGIVSAEETSL